jgi:hypothetical protein
VLKPIAFSEFWCWVSLSLVGGWPASSLSSSIIFSFIVYLCSSWGFLGVCFVVEALVSGDPVVRFFFFFCRFVALDNSSYFCFCFGRSYSQNSLLGCVCFGVINFISRNRRLEINIHMFVIKEYMFIPWNKLYLGIFFSTKRGVLFLSDDGGNFYFHIFFLMTNRYNI